MSLLASVSDEHLQLAAGPNFIIAGAPKCGTTALYEYLQTHPNVFLTEPKEPHYHADDLGSHRAVYSAAEYEELFRSVTPEHIAVGDASVWYMHSTVALPRVKQELPDVRFVVMLRHPIDLLKSIHSDLLWICFEDEPDFEKAWSLQEERRAGRHIPRLCQVPWFLDYRRIGSLGYHLSRMLDLYSADQVKIVLFDDFKQHPEQVYADVLAFLELPQDDRREFPRVNARKENRLRWLAQWQATVVRSLPRPWINMGKRFGLGKVSRGITAINTRESPSVPLRPDFRSELIREFRADIELLEQLIHRDLSHWKVTA